MMGYVKFNIHYNNFYMSQILFGHINKVQQNQRRDNQMFFLQSLTTSFNY